jgi:radical SAM-linked protein
VRLRIKFSKLGKVRFTSHRDVARIWERTIRRADVAVNYSEGFSPRPRLAFGLALSTGHESLAEYLDIDLSAGDAGDGQVDVPAVVSSLDAALPSGFEVMAAEVVDPQAGSLQQIVTSSSWLVEIPGIDQPTAQAAVDRLLAADTVVVTRERKGKPVEDDLRPAVLALEVHGGAVLTGADGGDGTVTLSAELGTQPRALRPSELLDALGLPGDEARVRRTHQWIHDGDARREPLPSAPNAVSSRAPSRDPRRESTDVRPTGHRPPDPAGGDTASRGDDTASRGDDTASGGSTPTELLAR